MGLPQGGLPRVLRYLLLHHGDQQFLLPVAGEENAPTVAERGSQRLRLLGQGLAVPHPHEEAQRSAGAAGETSRQGECTRGQARAHTIPATTQVGLEPGAAKASWRYYRKANATPSSSG